MSGDFLSRWSRRKRGIEGSEPEAQSRSTPAAGASPNGGVSEADAPPAADPPAATDAAPSAITSEGELAGLPPLHELTAATDLRPFLRAGVPAALRNAALRRMWSLDPGIRDFVSEAREYAYDWNAPGGVPSLGPLLQGDDVKAMVRRIFDRPPNAPVEGAEPHPAQTEAAAVDHAPGEAGAAVESTEAEANAGDVPVSPKEPGERADAAIAIEIGAATASRPIAAEAVPAPGRVRRHGGAVPR